MGYFVGGVWSCEADIGERIARVGGALMIDPNLFINSISFTPKKMTRQSNGVVHLDGYKKKWTGVVQGVLYV